MVGYVYQSVNQMEWWCFTPTSFNSKKKGKSTFAPRWWWWLKLPESIVVYIILVIYK